MGEERAPVDILIVEDDPTDVALTLRYLTHPTATYRIHIAPDGRSATDFLHRRGKYVDAPRPDLVLLDLKLPRGDGFSLLDEIKGDPELRSIPVIVLTSSEDPSDVSRCYASHANAYVSKPLDLERFVKTIRAIDEFWFEVAQLPSEDGD